MKSSRRLEWIQTILGLSAALMLASNPDQLVGFVAMILFFIKDIVMITFCKMHNFKGLLMSAYGYLCIDIWGIYSWWIF